MLHVFMTGNDERCLGYMISIINTYPVLATSTVLCLSDVMDYGIASIFDHSQTPRDMHRIGLNIRSPLLWLQFRATPRSPLSPTVHKPLQLHALLHSPAAFPRLWTTDLDPVPLLLTSERALVSGQSGPCVSSPNSNFRVYNAKKSVLVSTDS